MCKSVSGQIPKLVLCVYVEGCVEGKNQVKTLPKGRGRDLGALLKWSLNKNCQSQDRMVGKPFPGGSQDNMQHFPA